MKHINYPLYFVLDFVFTWRILDILCILLKDAFDKNCIESEKKYIILINMR